MKPPPEKQVCMIAYTRYSTDSRVMREAETLAAAGGYAVRFLALKEGATPRRYESLSVDVHELNVSKYRGKRRIPYIISYLSFFIRALVMCSFLSIAQKLDAVHVHNMPNFLVFAAVLPRLMGKHVILDIHDSIPETYCTKFDSSRTRLLFKLLCVEEALCCRFANAIICVNHVQRDALVQREIDSKKISVLLNVPDPRIFNRKRSKSDSANENAFRLVYHGTITRRLGIDIAITSVARLAHDIPGLEFFVMGTGEDLDAYINLGRKLGLNGQIHFNRKMIPMDRLCRMIAHMDLGVISNRKNSATQLMLPVKMLEYVALGIPVVAPKLDGIQRYFSQDMVQYFEPDNVESLTEAILDLYQNPAKRRAQAENAQAFLEKYGWETHKQELIRMYEEA